MSAGIEALVEPSGDGGWIVRAPRVGIYRGCPRAGGRRASGDAVGRLDVLNRSEELTLPPGVDGLVADIQVHDRAVPVEYGQQLFRLAPLAEAAAGPGAAGRAAAPGAPLPEGCFGVACPLDGVFYRRPSPTAPPFVEVGDEVEAGRTVGLIEAMKSFNAITYGGPGLPGRAVIVEVRATDAAEVRQGALLFVVKQP